LRPNYPEALNNRGIALQALGRHEDALLSYDSALALRPDFVAALVNRGIAQYEMMRFDKALADYDSALKLWPDNADALYNRGVALHRLERLDEALASYDSALALRPDYAEALVNRGLALHDLKQFDRALEAYDRALALASDHLETLTNRGVLLHDLARYDEALASHDRAIAAQPDHAAALDNRGVTLRKLGRLGEALASHDSALAAQPDYAEALVNRGVTLYDLKRFDEALASYDRAIALRPDHADAHFLNGLASLVTGDLPRGWVEYQWRRKAAIAGITPRDFPQPLWLGDEDIAGKTILLHSEQGFGDSIQFCRYAPLVAARGARVILEVEAPLRQLMTSLAGTAAIVAKGSPLPDFDLQCPLPSLPLAFKTTTDTIPSSVSYLRAPKQAMAHWAASLGAKRALRIGLAWAGNPKHVRDGERSMRLRDLSPLLDIGATFVSLQKEVRAGDAEILAKCGMLRFGERLGDFSDTAGLISQLDLVIAVDTGVAHLAGALGKPVWILLTHAPDWRWLLDREDSPWYPSARLFRQSGTREWGSVIARVADALVEFVESHGERAERSARG
jgi:tetratricopeptide (TPR) repeat protein